MILPAPPTATLAVGLYRRLVDVCLVDGVRQPYGWGASGNYGDPTTNVPYRWGTPGSPYESKPPWANVGGGN